MYAQSSPYIPNMKHLSSTMWGRGGDFHSFPTYTTFLQNRMGQQSNIIELVGIFVLDLSIWEFASMGFVSTIKCVTSIRTCYEASIEIQGGYWAHPQSHSTFELGVGMCPTSTYIDIQCIRVGLACVPSSTYLVILYRVDGVGDGMDNIFSPLLLFVYYLS